MPVLRRPETHETIELPPRHAQLGGECDVLVVGGGPAGLGAAVAAARAGKDVILAERYGFLGGNATAALVMPLMSFHTQRPTRKPPPADGLLPIDQGTGEAVIAGVVRELVERLVRAGGAITPSFETGYVVPFDPEVFKIVALDLLDHAGARMLLHAFASGYVEQSDAHGVVFETKSGPIVIRARAIVDCTGDADIATRAGAEYSIGREPDGLVQPMTLMCRMVDFVHDGFAEYVRRHPDQWKGVSGLWDLVQRATRDGELELAREDILFFATPHPHEVSLNCTRITEVLGTSVWDLTYAEWEGRRQLRQIAMFMRRYVPGFEEAYVAQSGVQVGVRETRRITGEYCLTAEDLLSARKFDDAIARGTYPVDIHNPHGKGTILKRVPPGEAYDIPLRALLPRDVEGVIVAGRCISGTHEALSAYRVMAISMATGQAAGICAAFAAERRVTPHDVPIGVVQEELRRQGADLG